MTVKDAYPLPRIEEILDQLAQGRFFTKLDLRQGYHRIRMHPEHAKRTAFQTKFGSYHFTVMHFGLANAPATFQRTMDFLLQDHQSFCRAYLDDIVIWSSSLEEHAQHVTTILQKLRDETFYAKQSKCTFAQTEIEYEIGFIVGRGGICTQPEKIQAVYDWQPPTNVKELRSFLGLWILSTFCRRLCSDSRTLDGFDP